MTGPAARLEQPPAASGTAVPRAPTLDDVARSAGVSRATVSRVLSGKRRVAADLQATVHAAVSEVGYVPNLAARALAGGRSTSVAVVISGEDDPAVGGVDTTDPFFGRVLSGLLRALRQHEVDPQVILAETDADRVRLLSVHAAGNLGGALLVSTRSDDVLPGMLVDAGVPAVLFARPSRPLPVNYVDVAHRDGAALAARHLVERGREHVVAIGGPPAVPAAHDRLAGFQDEMARHGQAWIPCVTGTFTYDSGAAAMRELLERESRVDGVFAANDLMALGALEVLRASGHGVPEDVSVVGFDDSTLGALAQPALTSVRQPIEEMTAEMVRILFDAVLRTDARVVSTIFDPALVVRASS